MKKLVVVLLLFAVSAEAQIRKMEVFTGNATTSWLTIKKATANQKINILEVLNESTTATDTLFLAFGKDTTAAYKLPIRVYQSQGASFYRNAVYLDSIRVKSTGTVPYLVIIH